MTDWTVDTTALRHWGYSNSDIEEAVLFLRSCRGSKLTGPPAPGELSLLTMCEAVNKLQQAGFDARLRYGVPGGRNETH